MSQENRQKTLITYRQGTFKGFDIYGFLYEDAELKTRNWRITVASARNETNEYWLDGNDVYAVSLHFFHPPDGGNYMVQHGKVEPETSEREAIEEAITAFDAPQEATRPSEERS